MSSPCATKFPLALLLLVISAGSHAQSNALDNPGFDSDLSGWSIFEGRVGVWSEVDAGASGKSGSALLSNQGLSNGNVLLVLHQCIGVQSGVEYPFGGDLVVPPNQPNGTSAFIFVQGFTNDDCTGSNPPGEIREVSSNAVFDWETVDGSYIPGAGIESLRIGLGVFKNIGDSAEAMAHYDNVFVSLPEPALVEPSKSASWFNPAESGHGIMIHLLNDTEAWMCWFTFDLDGNPAWICALGTIDGDTINFEDAFTVEGGAFPPNFDPALIQEVPWGSITVQFSGCNEGTMTWTTNAPGFQSGSMPVDRLTTLWGSTCQEG